MAAITESQAYLALREAQVNENRGLMASSAKLSAKDAESLFNKGMWDYSHRASLESLSYSVGVFSSAYKKVAAP